MLANVQTLLLLLVAEAATVHAAIITPGLVPRLTNCNGHPGAVNGQCTKWYQSNDCSGTPSGEVKGNCDGTCQTFENGIKSVKTWGDGTYGNSCTGFTGKNCETDTKVMQGKNSKFPGGDCGSPAKNDQGQDQIMYSILCGFKC